ncbi:hypothetical protein ACFLZ9_02175 [Patescibacteria group bacterium]
MYQEEHQDQNKPEEENSQIKQNVKPQGLTKEQRIGVVVLFIFAFLIIIFWAMQFRSSIKGPYQKSQDNNQAETPANQTEIREPTEGEMRNKDTDQDGLDDWEELNVYRTSPYLEDSDSDGYLDKQEIDSDNDPLCPLGRDCYGTSISDIDQPKTEDISPEEKTETNILDQFSEEDIEGLDPDAQQILEQLLSGQMNAESLRILLIEMGLETEIVNQLSDEQLMQSYQETLKSQE